MVQQGDILVGGEHFGEGSSRPAARVLKALGISCVVAESINGLFLRNCVNYGLAAIPCHGVAEAFVEGETAEIDLTQGEIRNVTIGTTRNQFLYHRA